MIMMVIMVNRLIGYGGYVVYVVYPSTLIVVCQFPLLVMLVNCLIGYSSTLIFPPEVGVLPPTSIVPWWSVMIPTTGGTFGSPGCPPL